MLRQYKITISPRLVRWTLFTLAVIAVVAFSTPPQESVSETSFVIKEGLSASEIGRQLEERHVVYSSFLFRLAVLLQAGSEELQAGNYLVEEPVGTWTIARRIIAGVYDYPQIRVRIPEGLTREQMADIFAGELVSFDRERFLRLTETQEGYLFPDTYFFFQNADETDVFERLTEAFDERTAHIRDGAMTTPYSFDELVTMASIIEREAHEPEDQRLIAGVFWNRLAESIPLQADATLYYLLGKPSSELTQADLDLDSPYNTYAYPGLPPGPISNPGLSALEAAVNPAPSDYFYYLSDGDGVTYFAETFEEHKQNRVLYLSR